MSTLIVEKHMHLFITIACKFSNQIFWLFQEYSKYDKKPEKYIKQWTGVKPMTGVPFSFDIGYERFLGPEVDFHSESCYTKTNRTFSVLKACIFFLFEMVPILLNRLLFACHYLQC